MLKSLKTKEAQKISKQEAFLVIREWIASEVDLALRKMKTDESFESPAWAERQSYHLGILKLADKVLQFIPDSKNNPDQGKQID